MEMGNGRGWCGCGWVMYWENRLVCTSTCRVVCQAWQIRKDKLRVKKQAAQTWVEDDDLPPLGIKVSASSRDPATVKGVQHTKCPTKVMREQLRSKQNKLKKMDEAWEKGEYVSVNAWKRLMHEIEDLAKRSDEASFAKGEPFTDSQGVRQLEPVATEANLVAIALDLYRKRMDTSGQ